MFLQKKIIDMLQVRFLKMKKESFFFYITSFIFIIICSLLWIVSILVSNNILLSYLALLVVVSFFLISYVLKQEETSVFLVFIISFIPVLLSNIYIEHGNYISEQGIWGVANNATVRLSFYLLLFFISSYVFWQKFKFSFGSRYLTARRIEVFETLTFYYSFVLVFISLLIFIKYGSPLLNGETRFYYWARLPDILNRIPMLIGFIFFFLGILVARKGFKLMYGFLMFLLICLMIFFGEKFTMPYLSALFFSMAFFMVKVSMGKGLPNLIKLTIFILFSVLILLSLAATGYIFMHDYALANVGAKVIDRALGLQGHVWYGVDKLVSDGVEIGITSDLLRPHTEKEPSGLVMLMWSIAPYDLVEIMRELNIRFTMGSPAIGIATVGYLGTIIYQILIAMISAFVLSYLHWATIKMNFFRILVGLVAFKVLMNVALMGEPQSLIKPLGLLVFSLIIIDRVITKLCRKY